MINIEGFRRPFKISISHNGDISCLTKSPTIKLYVIQKNDKYFYKSFADIGIHNSTQLAFNGKNEIALLDNTKRRLCLYSLALNQITYLDLPGSRYGALIYDKNNEHFYLSVLDLSVILKISSDCSINSIFFDYSKITDCKNVNGIAIDDQRLILLDTEQSALFVISLQESQNNVTRFLEFGRGGKGKIRQGTDLIIVNNNVVIIDKNNYLVQFFDLRLKFLEQIGGKGPGINQFDLPVSISEFDDDLYICDKNNDRIVILNKNKEFNVAISDKFKKGVLRRPSGIAVGKDGKIFVADRSNNVVQIFDRDLKFIDLLGSKSVKFNRPSSISIFNDEMNNNHIAILERKLGHNSSLNFYRTINGFGLLKHYKKFDESDLNDPQDMDISKSGLIYVADTLNRRILQIDLNGKIINQVDMKIISDNDRILIKTVSVRNDGAVFTADFDNCIVYEFNSELKKVRKIDFSSYKIHINVLRSVFALNDILLLCTRGKSQVLMANYKGKIIRSINCKKKSGLDWNHPVKICRSKDKSFIIADKENDRIVSLDKNLKSYSTPYDNINE